MSEETPQPAPKPENSQHSIRQNPRLRNPNKPKSTPGVAKAIREFGVTDLRVLLNQKHQNLQYEQQQYQYEQSRANRPPPDPSYNYLKDPEREQFPQTHREFHSTARPSRPPRSNGNFARKPPRNSFPPKQNPQQIQADESNSKDEIPENTDIKPQTQQQKVRGTPRIINRRMPRGRSNPPASAREDNKAGDISKPVNIKVEVSIGTGERSYTIDESTVLPAIKHVPDHEFNKKRWFGNTRGRGRSRGRGVGGRYSNKGFTGRKNLAGNKKENKSEEQAVEEQLADLNIDDQGVEPEPEIDDEGNEYVDVEGQEEFSDADKDSSSSFQDNKDAGSNVEEESSPIKEVIAKSDEK